MRKFISLALLGTSAALTPFAAQSAEPSQPPTMQAFFDRVRMKLDQLLPSRAMTPTTAIGGVRGMDVSAEDVYWKGENRVSPDELEEFNAALADMQQGRADKAKAGMQKFMLDHPRSALRAEATSAVQLLGAN